MTESLNILSALEQQVACYRKLARLAEAQREHVQQSHMEALLDVLQSRQAILDELAQLEFVVGPVKRNWPEFSADLASEVRGRAEELVAETRTLLAQIMKSDQTDVLALEQRKLNVGKQIKQATGARQINRNYATAAYGQRASKMDISR